MSQLSTVYDAFVTRISALLPNHTRISNAYDIEENNEQFLVKGWGLAIGGAVNSELFLSDKLTYQRTFFITITRKVFAREFDVESKATTEKLLIEDLVIVTNDFMKDTTLNAASSHVKYVADTGIERVFVDKDQYLKTQIEIQSTIIENL